MSDTPEYMEVEVEFDRTNIESVEREAARVGCSRDDVIGQAVGIFIERHRHVLEQKKVGVEGEKEASRTGHTAVKPPTSD